MSDATWKIIILIGKSRESAAVLCGFTKRYSHPVSLGFCNTNHRNNGARENVKNQNESESVKDSHKEPQGQT